MSKKILIANRGEIALRALRACRELGLRTVSVYSEIDKDLKHLKFSDETVCIGPAIPAESYLNIPSILSAAELTEVDAIYPGYGFLAENPDFAEQCDKSGFKFIGPNSDTIRKMGDKITAKAFVSKFNIPIVPGYSDDLPEDNEQLKTIVNDIGYPVIIKATAGGGGRGMRIVEAEDELLSTIDITMQEAGNAFGNNKIYIEKFIENPRHIEVQIVGDGKGNAIHLGTRDCSMQRRHQKIIEEAPALDIDSQNLQNILDSCVNLCKEINYEGVGTLEFLYENKNFYFIEMNTRIQVEHPVTEMVTGVDLIAEQINIAAGHNLEFNQEQIHLNGHAIECRINAEDPFHNFRPSPGKITGWLPPGGPGVRVDSHVYTGYEIPPFYDSLIGKLIVWGKDRDTAIKRMNRALNECAVTGIPTTINFHLSLLDKNKFKEGKIHTKYVEEELLPNL